MRAGVVWLLFSMAPLTIVNTAIRQMEDGAPLPAGFTHVPGEILFFSFQIEGYQVSPEQKIHLSCRVEALDPKEVRVLEPIESVVDATLSPQDKEWKPKVQHQIAIPPLGPSGMYKIRAQVKDDLSGATAAKEVSFEVRGHDVAPSDSLTVRNFHYYRSEDDTQPMPRGVYRPGETLWARFDLVGYKFAEGNKIDVSYGIAVLSPAGKVLFTQPEAAAERTSSFYPQPYIPGSMNLSLQPTIRPGDYTIVLTARDAIGNQSFESKQVFTIE